MPQPFWDYDPTLDPLSAAMMRTRKAGELDFLPTLPGQLPETVNRGIRNVFGGILGPATAIPKKAAEAAQEYTETGQYNPEPVMDAATVAMTGGIPFKVPGTSLTSGIARRQPPLVGAYHGTMAEDFTKLKLPEWDMGIHISQNPNTASQYAINWGRPGIPEIESGSRVMPVVADIRNPFPLEKPVFIWKPPQDFKKSLAHYKEDLPEGILYNKEFVRAANKNIKGNAPVSAWWKDVADILESKGYDALNYSHGGLPIKDSYMVWNPDQLYGRFSPEGQRLIKQRGVIEPEKKLIWGWK